MQPVQKENILKTPKGYFKQIFTIERQNFSRKNCDTFHCYTKIIQKSQFFGAPKFSPEDFFGRMRQFFPPKSNETPLFPVNFLEKGNKIFQNIKGFPLQVYWTLGRSCLLGQWEYVWNVFDKHNFFKPRVVLTEDFLLEKASKNNLKHGQSFEGHLFHFWES